MSGLRLIIFSNFVVPSFIIIPGIFFKVFIKSIKKPDIMVAYYPCGEIVCNVILYMDLLTTTVHHDHQDRVLRFTIFMYICVISSIKSNYID